MAENIRTTPLRLRPSEHRALLLIGDLVMSTASVFAALYTWREYNFTVQFSNLLAEGLSENRALQLIEQRVAIEVPIWFFLLPILWTFLLVDLYEPYNAGSGRRTTRGIAIAAFVGLLGYSLVFLLRQNSDLPRVGVGAFLLFASLLTLGWRMIFIRIYKRTGQLRRMLIVGAGQAGMTLARLYESLGTRSFSIIGFVDDDKQKQKKTIHGLKVLGPSERLLALIDEHRISDLVVAINGEIQGATFQTILDAQEKGVEVTRMPILYEEMTGRLPIHHLESDWIIRSFVDEVRVSGFYELTKRLLDFVGGLIGMIVFLLLFPIISLAILLDSGLPILYTQTRLGKGGRRFKIYKFRTMKQNAEQDGEAKLAEKNDPRVTRVGDFLRKTRLDEFPQFWNVMRGDMSLVGPRAERPELVAAFQKQVPFYRARLLVKPGVSGWAQINYGYYASITEMAVKLEYDLYYIKHRTLAMDFQIILRTIGTMLRRTGR
ncbi:MAG: sugar transferase [Anaerolineales bacterium]|nr:sugar transferase [Anaerolineales bacterium]